MLYRAFPAINVPCTLQLILWVVSLGTSLALRATGSRHVQGTEMTWTFGQLLAIFILGPPFLNTVEIFCGKFGRTWHQQRTNDIVLDVE